MVQPLWSLKKILAPFFIIGLLTWLFFYANFHFSQVFDYFFTISLKQLLICVFLFVIHTLLICYAWLYILRGLGLNVPFWQAAIVFGTSNIAKYLPGGVWQISSRAVGLTSYQGNPVKVTLSLFIEQTICLSASCILAILLLPEGHSLPWTSSFPSIPKFILLGTAAILLLCCLSPHAYRLLLNFIPKLDGTYHLEKLTYLSLIKINFFHYLSLIIYSLGYWICIKFYIHTFSMGFYEFSALLMLATFTGFIAIFTPAGLGVREAILFAGIQSELGNTVALTLAIIPRLLIIISEVLFFLSILFYRYYLISKKQ